MQDQLETDYVIIGAGSAGCVMAARLSENGRNDVTLVEAGGSDSNLFIKIPVGYAYTFTNKNVNWCYETEPDAGLNGRNVFWPRGRVVGGSSSINAMAYMRGLPRDFDDWEHAGGTGWNWSAARALYERMETRNEPGKKGRKGAYGSGPVWVSDVREEMHPFSSQFLDAGQELGWPTLDDLNGRGTTGLGFYRSTVRNGRRWSAADAFLRPALKRDNLNLIRRALVTKILVENGRAIGISYEQGGKTRILKARRDVILSAGAVNSPQLMMLSGIGPASDLKSHGIDVVHDLPEVGKGMQDHLAITHSFRASKPTLNAVLGYHARRILCSMQYVLTRTGPLSVPVNQVGGYVASQEDQPEDMQLFCNPLVYETKATGIPHVGPEPGFILSAQPSRPTSRGEITLRSSDPKDTPRIQPNSVSTEADQNAAIRAGHVLRGLLKTAPMMDALHPDEQPPLLTMSDEDMLADYRERASTVFHASCTCRMGRDATDSVVDANLRVHGLQGLRIVDASAFPNVTSGNTNAPVMMLAMGAADRILAET